MSTSSLVFRVTSDVATATAGFRKLAASLKPVKKEADQTSTSLAKIGKTQVAPKVNAQAIHKVTTEIARLQDEMRKALELDVHADTREVQRKIRGLTTTLRQLKAPKITPDVDTSNWKTKLRAGLSDVTGGLAKLGGGLKSVFSNIGVPLIGAVGVAVTGLGVAIGGTAAKALGLADSMERAKIQMTGFTKNTEVTEKLLGQIQDFADQSPFEFPELVSASRRMLGVGVQAKKIPAQLKKIGDIAAQSGAEVDDLALIFAQMTAAGRVNAEDMNQLADRGVNAWPTLAKAMGKTVAQVRELGEKGKLGRKEIDLLWQSLSEGSEGATAKLSQTFSGQLSTLKDTATGVLRDIGNALLPFAKVVTPLLTAGLKDFGAGIVAKLPGVVNVIAGVATALLKLPGVILSGLADMAIGIANFISGIQRATGDEAGALKTLRDGSKVYDTLKGKATAYDDSIKGVTDSIEAARQAAQAGLDLTLKTREVDGQISAVKKRINQIQKNIKNPKLKADKRFWDKQLTEANKQLAELQQKKANITLDAKATGLKTKIADANKQLAELGKKKSTPEIRAKIDDLKRKKADALHDLAVINVKKANPKLKADSAEFKRKVAEAERKLKETDKKRANPKIKVTNNAAEQSRSVTRILNDIPDENVIIHVLTRGDTTSPSNIPGTNFGGTSVTGQAVPGSARPSVQINVNDAKLASLIDVRVNGRAARASKIVRRKAAVVL